MSQSNVPIPNYQAPITGDLDQRLKQMGNDLSTFFIPRIQALENRVTTLEGEVTQLAQRQMRHASASRSGAQPSTNSTTYVHMGLGVTLTPLSTRWFVLFEGQISNASNNGYSYAQVRWGSGTTPPAQGAAAAGTALGLPVTYFAPQANGVVPFSQSQILAGLTIGAPYWLDVAIRASPGAITLSDIELVGFGLLDPYAFPAPTRARRWAA